MGCIASISYGASAISERLATFFLKIACGLPWRGDPIAGPETLEILGAMPKTGEESETESLALGRPIAVVHPSFKKYPR
jgi:hypothetical protein